MSVHGRQCAIVAMFWQMDTGLIVVVPFPDTIETKAAVFRDQTCYS